MPTFQRPEKPLTSAPVLLDTIPLASRSGFRRHTNRRAFLVDRALSISLGYLVLDICCCLMRQDPYFIFGPTAHPLPLHLAHLSPLTLWVYRSLTAFAGVLAALHMILSFDQVVRCLLLGPLVFGIRGELWHYPTVFGSFTNVLDRGLGGFWGGWWHQSFRVAFAAPTAFLVRKGHLVPGSMRAQLVGLILAFLQSGFMHAAGGVTSLPRTKWWLPPLFFLSQATGIALQTRLCTAFQGDIDRVPRAGRRLGNLVFTAVWLLVTQRLLIDDLSSAALWLFEPVPVSVVRAYGFGGPGDEAIWRWDRDHFPKWYWGKHWWQTGLGI